MFQTLNETSREYLLNLAYLHKLRQQKKAAELK